MEQAGDAEFVQSWFRARADYFGVPPDKLIVADIRRLSRGVSRQTWAVTVDCGSGVPSRVAVRRDHEAGNIVPTSLRTEFELYDRLKDSGIPIAPSLWFEDDPKWMPDGRPAYVRELVDGEWYLPALADESPDCDEERIALSKEHIDNLLLVHSLDWQRLGLDKILPAPRQPDECALSLIDHYVRQLAEFGAEPSVVLAEGIASLRERAPRDAVSVRLCKGTNGHGEEVWRAGKIVALSDWELAALGDPAYDFAQCQEMIPEIERNGRPIWGMAQALEYYVARGGDPVTLERISYYRDLYGLLQFVYTQHASALARTRPDIPIRFVWTAVEVAFRSELRLAREYAGDLMRQALA